MFWLMDKFAEAQIATSEHLFWQNDVGVDKSKDDIAYLWGGMDRYFHLLIPDRISSIFNGLSARVNHSKLYTNIGVSCLAIHWFDVFPFEYVHY